MFKALVNLAALVFGGVLRVILLILALPQVVQRTTPFG
jgi:hypothetical protein